MIEFFKSTILKTVMTSPDIHGSFFDEVDSFVEGGYGNHPFSSRVGGPYQFSSARKANITSCFMDAMDEIVRFMASGGKFAIPSTNAYVSQYADFGQRQKAALSQYGGFKFVESFCPPVNGGSWVCPMHTSRASCCLDQLLSIKEHASLGVPLMITAQGPDEFSTEVQVICPTYPSSWHSAHPWHSAQPDPGMY